MNRSSKMVLFPWVSLLAGGLGLALRVLLLSTMDNQGLLPENHFAGIVCFLLLAAVMGICFWQVRMQLPSNAYRKLFPPSLIAAIGTAVGAVGMGISVYAVNAAGILRLLIVIAAVLGAGAMLYAAYCRFVGLRPSCLLHILLAAYLVLRVLACCRNWGTQTQLQLYFFQLLGSLFLLIACYYRAEADALIGDYRKYIFFSQAALFCCCLCLNGTDWLFYLSAAVWLTADNCIPPRHE